MPLIVLFAAVGMALGLTPGGYLAASLSWNRIFFINIMSELLLSFSATLPFQTLQSPKHHLKALTASGAVLVFVWFAAFLFAFSKGITLSWTSLSILAAILFAAICLNSFVWCELH
ncbi:MAG: hypothetical protein LBU24_05750 [Methanocalculaceae archaeon]|nr:hypothetical protein [Methanocalculaceae archaeon]